MESEGPQSSDGNREKPAHPNVVRLGDWIGPRDELVPFARRKGYRVHDGASEPSEAPPPDAPPSADDFWGERAAAIHDAVQAPIADPAAAGTRAPRATPRARRARMAGVAGVAAAGLACAAIALNVFATGATHAGGPRMALASVLNNRLARILSLDLSQVQLNTHPTSRRSGHPRRRSAQSRPISEAVHYTARISHSSATAHTTRVTPSSPAPAVTAPPTTNTSTSSSAAVSPTGESGALGPIQSPNG